MRWSSGASFLVRAVSILTTSFNAWARKRSVTAAANLGSPPHRLRTACMFRGAGSEAVGGVVDLTGRVAGAGRAG